MKKKIIPIILLSLVAVFSCSACGKQATTEQSENTEQSQTVTPTVTLDQESVTLKVGQTTTLSASVRPISVSGKPRLWSSSDGKVAKVDGTGFVTAVGEGTAVITVEVEGVTKQCVVTVVTELED